MKKEFILVISLVAIIALSGCTRSVCGNGTCERDETTANCAVDCGPSMGGLEVTVVSGFIGGTHLSGAQVVVTGYDTNVVTNKNGIALFEGLLPGTYHITASKEGYLPKDANATVIEGQVTNVRIKLPLVIPEWNCGDGNCTSPEDVNNCSINCGTGVWSSLRNMGGAIFSLAIYDCPEIHDANCLYIGQCGGILKTYNSNSGVWSRIDTGDMRYSIHSLAVYDGNLFTGQSGGLLGTGLLGTYGKTGNSYVWSPLGSIGYWITSLAVYDGNLFTGDGQHILGTYGKTGNSYVWSPLKNTGYWINSLTVYDGNLFIGDNGNLKTYDSNSNTLSDLGVGGPTTKSLTVYDGNIFVGHGELFYHGFLGTYRSGVWSSLGDKGCRIGSLTVYDGNLFTGQDDGTLGTYGKTGNSYVWSPLVTIEGGYINSLAVYGGKLFTGQSGNYGVLGYYSRR